MRSVCAFASKPPCSRIIAFIATSPPWPNGACPMSCARHTASIRLNEGTRARSSAPSVERSRSHSQMPDPICATSSECVSRVR